jgi:hypothetical protein
MSEQEAISASSTNDTSTTQPADANVAVKAAPLTKLQLIEQRQQRKQIQEYQRRMSQKITRGEVFSYLAKIDSGLQRMDQFVALHQNVLAFLQSKGVFTQAEYDAWDAEKKKAIADAKAAADASTAIGGEVHADTSDGAVRGDSEQEAIEG